MALTPMDEDYRDPPIPPPDPGSLCLRCGEQVIELDGPGIERPCLCAAFGEAPRIASDVRVAYMAHSGDHDFASVRVLRMWLAWLRASCPNRVMIAQQPGTDIVSRMAMLQRCDELVLVGDRITADMHAKVLRMRKLDRDISDLTWLQREQPPLVAIPDVLDLGPDVIRKIAGDAAAAREAIEVRAAEIAARVRCEGTPESWVPTGPYDPGFAYDPRAVMNGLHGDEWFGWQIAEQDLVTTPSTPDQEAGYLAYLRVHHDPEDA